MKEYVVDPFTKIFCLNIVPRFGEAIRLSSYPMDIWLSPPEGGSPVLYRSEYGTELTDYDTTTTLTPSVMELQGVLGEFGITRERLLREEFNGAKGYVFATSWLEPIENDEPVGVFLIGKTKITDDTFSLEMNHILDALNLTPELSYTENCLNTFCDDNLENNYTLPLSWCKLNSDDFVVTGVITTSPGNGIFFSDDLVSFDDDWFGEGLVRFNIVDGGYITKPFEVLEFESTDGKFVLAQIPLYSLPAGTEFTIRAGCRKRLIDCRDKFDNVLGQAGEGGFLGFPNIPTNEQSGKVGGF